jgi:hypothetical protein
MAKVTVTLEKGTKGDTGAQGDAGAQGIQGVKGDTGDTGEAGSDGVSPTTSNVAATGALMISSTSLSDIGIPASGDRVLIQDIDDSNQVKFVPFSDFTTGTLSNISEDGSPQLGANLDVQARSLFTSTSNGDIQFTPNGTGSVNLDGTVKFKRFAAASAPDPFAGGMYADDNDILYFGVS